MRSEEFLIPQGGDMRAAFAEIQAQTAIGRTRVFVSQCLIKRTVSQNSLLWALYGDILKRGGEAMGGWTKDDLHEFFLINHFGSTVRELFGRKRLKPRRRSSKLSKMEFSDFVESIVRFMAEQGVVLDLPGDFA